MGNMTGMSGRKLRINILEIISVVSTATASLMHR